MKSPEYAAAAVRLYRAVIDRGRRARRRGVRAARPGRPRPRSRASRPRAGCARRRDRGSSTPGSPATGARAWAPSPRRARANGRGRAWIRFTLEADLSLRDGLAFMSDDGTEQHAFSVQEIRQGGRDVRFARAGETVEVLLPPEVPAARVGAGGAAAVLPVPGPPGAAEGSVAPYRAPIAVEAVARGRPGRGRDARPRRASDPSRRAWRRHVTLEPAERPRPFVGILGPLLAESGDSLFIGDGERARESHGARRRPHLRPALRAEAGEEPLLCPARRGVPRLGRVAGGGGRPGTGSTRPRPGAPRSRRSSPRSPTGPRSRRGAAARCRSRGSRRTARSTPAASRRRAGFTVVPAAADHARHRAVDRGPPGAGSRLRRPPGSRSA